MKARQFFRVALAAVVLGATAPLVQAADSAPAAPARTTPDQQTLRRFVAAYLRVSEIQSTLDNALSETSDPKKQTSLKQQADQLMTQAITESGLTVHQYNALGTRIQQDPPLHDQVKQMIHQARVSYIRNNLKALAKDKDN
ncbi:MAG: DUF4168 domain-containing protein [Gammaproteobacteria bacterium]|jgi:hypothetical protein